MSLPIRLGLFYSALFIGSGVSSPYMPVWFAHHGLNGAQIGLILSLLFSGWFLRIVVLGVLIVAGSLLLNDD